MITIKSFSVGNGDMFYISQGNSLTTVDCCLDGGEKQRQIISEIKALSIAKNNTHFISTHPDEDHIHGLADFEKFVGIRNFYCTKNEATETKQTDSFKKYCELRDSNKAHYVYKGYSITNANISFLWPNTVNRNYREELMRASKGESPNNLSPIFALRVPHVISAMWMGDIEHDFLDEIKGNINWHHIDILFAPHHGRKSGMIPADVLRQISPKIIVIGEANSEYLYYYPNYNTITQNSADDIIFKCQSGRVHVYVGNYNYDVKYLENDREYDSQCGHYLGSFTSNGE